MWLSAWARLAVREWGIETEVVSNLTENLTPTRMAKIIETDNIEC